MISEMEIAFSVGFVTTFLVLWFETNVVVEYVNFFHLGGSIDVCEYDDYELDGKCKNYPEYLLVRYPSFYTKLISCPYCIGFWSTVICCIFLGLPFVSWAMIYILSLLVYLSMCKLSR
jgi:hypothetical protein